MTSVLLNSILARLHEEDDPALWAVAVDVILADANALCEKATKAMSVLARVGACSHWLRPHQFRWTADGGFAAPVGFPKRNPEFDWSVEFRWKGCWTPILKGSPLGHAVFWVTLPTRTKRHRQAAVRTMWTPGTPVNPKRPLLQMYGFRKQDETWRCTAYFGEASVYEEGELRVS